MDVHTQKQRSYNMSQIKCKNTKPEIIIRKWLWSEGYRYRLHYKGLPGKPDIVFSKLKKVIFVNGCFWHKHNCKYFKWPKTNEKFWKVKINENVKRDQKNHQSLLSNGWSYFIIWECQIKEKKLESLNNIKNFIEYNNERN